MILGEAIPLVSEKNPNNEHW